MVLATARAWTITKAPSTGVPSTAGVVPAPPAARRPAGRPEPAAGYRLRRDDPGRDTATPSRCGTSAAGGPADTSSKHTLTAWSRCGLGPSRRHLGPVRGVWRVGVRHSCAVGMNSRVVALAVLSVVLAVVLGLEAGLRAGPLAGVLSALAGFVPAVVWELARGWRERAAGVADKRAAALEVFASAGPRADAGVGVDWAADSGAAWLLRPEAEVVGFRSRPELDELVEWCAAGGRLGVRLVTGEGGSGKTRLALQLETELVGHGWRTLWVERGREGSAVAAVRGIGEPAVLVVDYAETRPGLAGLLAEAAAAGACPDMRVESPHFSGQIPIMPHLHQECRQMTQTAQDSFCPGGAVSGHGCSTARCSRIPRTGPLRHPAIDAGG